MVITADVLQIGAASVAAASAGWRWLGAAARGEGRSGRAWSGLFAAFLCWIVGQAFSIPSDLGIRSTFCTDASEGFWLLFDFSLLLVASLSTPSSHRGWVAWIEAGQSFLFLMVLTALMLPIPGVISPAATDILQVSTLLLVFAVRFVVAEPGADRRFYRCMLRYMAVYLTLCVTYYAGLHWRPTLAPVLGLCWSLPVSAFSTLILLDGVGEETAHRRSRKPWWEAKAAHLEGLVSCAIASMALCAAGALTLHRPLLGGVALALNFLGLAARYMARERQLRLVQAQLGHELVHDPLTGLANRKQLLACLHDRLAAENQADEQEYRPGIIFIGMDRFKTVNEALGPVFGDELLSRVAARLTHLVGDRGMLARYGSDEFVILVAGAERAGLQAFGDELLKGIGRPIELAERVLHLTASAGCAVARPNEDVRELLTDTLSALYQAKSLGRNRAVCFDPTMTSLAASRLEMEQGLRQALLHDRIEVHFQPIYSLPGRAIAGFEALARWRDPVRGFISPGEFIPVAESAGMIHLLGAYVLRAACRQLRVWHERFDPSLFVTVNVSALELMDPGLLDRVVSTLRSTGVRGEHLKLEVTESALLNGYAHAEQTLEQARSLGIEICLDDFGTGYSSLSYLLNLPMDVVKIDRSFVRDQPEGGDATGQDQRRAALLGSITQLVAALGKRVVIEGVESGVAMQRAQDLGCQFVQGFFLSKPLPAEEAGALLSEGLRTPAAPTLHPVPRSTTWLPVSRGEDAYASL